MTNIANTFDGMFKNFSPYFIGTEEFINRMNKIHSDINKNATTNYPPYNIRKTGENTYQIEMAVAGFSIEDINIEVKEDTLIVACKSIEDSTEHDYVYRGIANRAFSRAFTLNEQIVVDKAEMLNGMLKIFLEKIVPENKKSRKIEINYASDAKLLTE